MPNLLYLFQSYADSWQQEPLLRTLSLLTMVLYIAAMGFRSEKKVKLGLAAGAFFSIYPMYAFGSTVAALTSVVAAIRLTLSAYETKRFLSRKKLAAGFSVLYVGILLSTYKSPLDFLAFLATTLNTWATFTLKGLLFRAVLVCTTLMWVVFDFAIGAFEIGVATTLSAIVALYSFIRQRREDLMQKP